VSRAVRYGTDPIPSSTKMPTYEYRCQSCDHQFEVFQSMKDERLTDCPLPECSGQVKRLLGTGAGIIFKGSGFYETDYRSESYKKAAKADSSSSETKSSPAETSASSSKGSSEAKSTSSGDSSSASSGSGSSGASGSSGSGSKAAS